MPTSSSRRMLSCTMSVAESQVSISACRPAGPLKVQIFVSVQWESRGAAPNDG